MDFTPIPGEQLPVLLAPDERFGPWAVVPRFVVLDDADRAIRCSGMSIEWCPMMLAREAGNAFARRDANDEIIDDDSTVPWSVASPETMPPPEELTSTVVRSIAVATQIERARRALPDLEALANALDGWARESGGTAGPSRERTFITDPRRRRAKKLDDEHYRRVADEYRDAFTKPRQYVAHYFDVSPATASDYIREARRRGFLPPTTRGKATNNDEDS